MLKPRIYSDLHQEFKLENPFEIAHSGNEQEQALIIAGDYFHHAKKDTPFVKAQLQNYADRFNQVFLIFGNHDFYGKKSKLGEKYVKEYAEFLKQFGDNVHLLSRHTPSVVVGEQVFIGATLWTDLDKSPPESIATNFYAAESNDFLKITYVNNKGYSNYRPVHWLNEFIADSRWIKQEVEKYKDKEIIVATHFAPSLQCVDLEDKTGKYVKFYKSDLDNFIIDHPQIKLWGFGHIHNEHNLIVGETHLFSNPIGYYSTLDNNPHKSFPENFRPQNVISRKLKI